jgi:DNA-binding transcriptional LysR family regulator
MGRIGAAAPGMRVITRGLVRSEALTALAGAELDLALGYFWGLPDQFISETLYREDYAVVGRKSDALMNQRLTLKRYAAARHVIVSPAGDLSGIVDQALEREGLQRTVIAAAPLFFPALAMVAETGGLATVPRRFAARYARLFQLKLAEPPLPIRNFDVSAVRHKRDAHNAMHHWLIALIKGTIA